MDNCKLLLYNMDACLFTRYKGDQICIRGAKNNNTGNIWVYIFKSNTLLALYDTNYKFIAYESESFSISDNMEYRLSFSLYYNQIPI